METRICSKCGEELDIAMFYKNKCRKDGYKTECKECEKRYREVNKEKIAEYKKQYREKNSKKLSEYGKKYSRKNKDKKEKYREEKKEYIARKVKEYSENHKEEINRYLEKNKITIALQKKRYKEKNKDRIDEYNKLWYDENKSHVLEYAKQYVEQNKEAVIKTRKKYKKDNKDKITRYRKDNLEKFRIYSQNRRSVQHGLAHNLTDIQWITIKQHFKNSCAYCGKELPLTQEHFLASSKGGEYTVNNIIPSCQSCNSSKNNKDALIWFRGYKYFSKKREKNILKFLGIEDDAQQLKMF